MTKEEFKVTPWEVSGNVDYLKLSKQFGTNIIDNELLSRIKKHTKDLHFMLRRKIFFSHRDMNWILDEYEKGNNFFLYTGRGPSGYTHIGHLAPYVFTQWLQEKFGVEVLYQLTDDEKFLFKDSLSLENANKLAHDNALDFIACGFNPKKTKILIDTENSNTLYPIALKFAKKITFSTAKAVFGFQNENNIGQIFYTSMQSAPAVLPSVLAKENIPCLVPMGIDQDPHFRITRDVASKLGWYKPAAIHKKMFPSLNGIGAMTAGVPATSIYVADTPELVKKKIGSAFSGGGISLAEHKKHGGNPDVDVCYKFLEAFFEPNDKKLTKIYNDYKSGKMPTSELKSYTTEKINKYLKEHQKARVRAEKQVDKFMYKDQKSL